ncbi:MAG: hypothetical protein ABS32_02070 [Verrucomicrobia subdivision 6 bacterium BACL9 MAG-120820-bin42]|uniref:Uncharacterized protein n=1 Tax=Verrucomicrobia subdivision 6 bacterium BACL9 MAG-120820-bin42 TaxID=1655634 RepID=A0A0R2X9Z7_9BACT|nr:MAG: hypothetical protein ABS32_02070 [Verrucomicrobia subdivision 6 bacterium BACL9 MAG-120820-bin42]
MPGDVEKLGIGPRDGGWGGVGQKMSGLDRAEALGQAEGEHRVGLKAERGGVGVVGNGATGPIDKVGGVPDMVPVAVGEEKGVRLHFFLFQKIEKALGGIDGEEMAVKVEQVGVGRGKATRISQRFFHGLLGRGDEGLRD